ncbi:hypothetical protein BpHYR1_016029 [Brachionus plicatilis]|uniref:Uncharacterized protein n=1 Tax=Brachionus plicatilis TaxID=10195 RepID=A0A3M7RFU9_BRAPC|nr:hypothetical protein BpHYR1_016029 [Brachionus plicatilis]
MNRPLAMLATIKKSKKSEFEFYLWFKSNLSFIKIINQPFLLNLSDTTLKLFADLDYGFEFLIIVQNFPKAEVVRRFTSLGYKKLPVYRWLDRKIGNGRLAKIATKLMVAKLRAYFNHKSGQHVYLVECINKRLELMMGLLKKAFPKKILEKDLSKKRSLKKTYSVGREVET